MSKFPARVEIYSTPTCPYCMMAKSLLTNKGAEFEDVTVVEPAKREIMMERAGGRRTVPQIFINNQHVGGFDDMAALERAGKLDTLLSVAA